MQSVEPKAKWNVALGVDRHFSFGYRPWKDDNAPIVHEVSIGRLRISFWKEEEIHAKE